MAHVEDRWKNVKRSGKGKRWRVRYTDPAGAERSRSFDRKYDADRFRSAVEADIDRGSWVDPRAGRLTLREFTGTWLAGRDIAATTREQLELRFRVHIFPTFGDLALARVAQSPMAIQAWQNGLEVSDGYRGALLVHLSSVLDAAVAEGRILRNPCRSRAVTAKASEPEPEMVSWTRDQVAAVRAALRPRFRGLLDAGAWLGLRQGEVIGLAADDIDWLKGWVTVRRQVVVVRGKACFAPTKTRRERRVPLPPEVRQLLAAHLAKFPAVTVSLPWKNPDGKPQKHALMFTSLSRRPYWKQYLDRVWRDAVEAAKMTPGRPNGFHALRHFYASHLLMAGEAPGNVSGYLGHTSPAFTQRVYGHFIPGSDERARSIIDALVLGPTGPVTAHAVNESAAPQVTAFPVVKASKSQP